MRKQLLLFITMLACACGILRAASYNLVTSADQLNDTDEFIFVSGQPIGDSYYVVTSMTTSGGSSTAISNLTSLETTIEISDNINPLIFQFKDVTATATNVTKKVIYEATNGKYIGRKTASMLNLSTDEPKTAAYQVDITSRGDGSWKLAVASATTNFYTFTSAKNFKPNTSG